jgi:hypothetical protein
MKKLLLVASTLTIALTATTIAHAQIYVAPQPVVVVQNPQPTVVYAQPQVVVQEQVRPAPVVNLRPQLRNRGTGLGLRAAVGYAGSNELTFYGAGAVLRYIANPRFGLELAVDVNGCEEAIVVPIELSGLVFFNTRGRVQPYLVAGVDFNIIAPNDRVASFLYAGGHFGVGLEILVGRRLGITLDARTFVQGLAHSVEKDVEYGVTVNTGFNFYFPGHRRI